MVRIWNEYDLPPATVNRDKPHASLDKQGTLLLNKHAYEKMGSPEAVVLLFDQQNRVVGLRPSKTDKHNAFPLKHRYLTGRQSRLGIMAVQITGFCKMHNLIPKRSLSFKNPKFENGVLELDTKTAVGA